jgi:hypothetical protein
MLLIRRRTVLREGGQVVLKVTHAIIAELFTPSLPEPVKDPGAQL